MEQMRAVLDNIPALYVMLNMAALALSLTFFNKAPAYLTIGVLAVAIPASLWRIRHFRKAGQEIKDPVKLKRMMHRLDIVAIIIFASIAIWIRALIPYANDTERVMLSFFTAFTGASAVLCAMSRPRIVAMCLSILFLEYCILFIGLGEGFFMVTSVLLGGCYLVFVQFSMNYKKRIEQTVNLHNELLSENARSNGLAESNRSLALSDTLTGLPNRRSFFEEAALYYGRSPIGQLPVIGIVDLDGFKPINDVFGHTAGDAVLVETARRLKAVIGESGSVARLGGDEFAYALPWNTPQTEVTRTAYAIVSAMAKPVILPNGDASRVSASIGFSSRNFHVQSANELLEQADFALFRAKEVPMGCAVEFSSFHAASKRREAIVHEAFKVADLENEIHIVFQPIVNSTDGTISSCEALARWDSREIGTVSPGEFVPIAEKAGMTQEMTRIVLRKTLEHMKTWPGNMRVSLNLSAQDVNSRHTTDALASMLIKQPRSLRERICIEVTETSLLTDFEEVRNNLMKFRELGLKIALDDFGTGYSSLRYIQELEFDIVKIDRSFIASVEDNAKSFGLVRVIQQLCRSLAIDCVAEGVETPGQLEKARLAGCQFVQGYLYSEPLLSKDLIPYLTGDIRFPDYRDITPDRARLPLTG